MSALHPDKYPVRPPIENTVDLYPNEIYSGGVASEGIGPEVEQEDFEDWAPVASPPAIVVSRQQRERHELSGHVRYQSW